MERIDLNNAAELDEMISLGYKIVNKQIYSPGKIFLQLQKAAESIGLYTTFKILNEFFLLKIKREHPSFYLSVNDAIEKIPGLKYIKEALKTADVVIKFPEAIPELKDIAIARRFKDGILFLYVESSIWRNEINLNSDDIILRINIFLNEMRIKKIKFSQ